jgi:hypothetical protein
MVIYESAPAVNPEFESLAAPAAPLVTGLDTLLRSRPEDKGNAGERPERRAGGGDGLGT